jgi:LPXTG-motif cell wall-anchored protein
VPPGGGDGVGDGGGVLPPDDGVVPPADGVGDGDGVAPPGDGATDGEVGGDGATDGDAADQVGGDGDSGAVVPAVDGGDAGLTGGDVGNGPTAGDGTSGAAPAEPGGGSTPATDAPTDVSSPCWFTAPATSGGPARSSLTCGDGASPSTPWPNDAMAMPANAASVSTPTGENVAGVRTSARRDSRGVAVTRLPRTGHDVAHLALFGAALVAAGGALLLMRGGTAQGAAPGSGAPLTSARVLPFGGVLVVTHPHARIRELRRMPIG